MNNRMINIYKEYFSWSKNDFIITMFSSALLWILPKIYNIHWALLTFAWIVVIVKCFLIYTRNSSIPNVTSVGDMFSWRFFQNLPLTKKNLVILISVIKLLESLPLLISFLLAYPFFVKSDAFVFLKDLNLLKFVVNYILFVMLLSVMNVAYLINYPRIAYDKKNKNSLIPFIEMILFLGFLFIYFQLLSFCIYKLYAIDLNDYLLNLVKSVTEISLTWWFPLILTLFIVYHFRQTLNTWRNEKASYTKPINEKKRFRNIGLYVFLIAVPFLFLDNNTPDFYSDSLLNKATYQKNYSEIDKLLKQKYNINQANSYGFTPMFTAIHEGDLKTAKFLESRGASLSGYLSKSARGHKGYSAIFIAIDSNNKDVLEYVISKGVNVNEKNIEGFYPIHLASRNCRSDLIDLLIKNGADINLTNKEGYIPAVVAIRTNCLSAVVTLKEAGANFDILDKKGKSIADHTKDQSEEIRYIINKFSSSD